MSHICNICEFWMTNKEAETHNTETCAAMVEAANVCKKCFHPMETTEFESEDQHYCTNKFCVYHTYPIIIKK